ncbi:MAG: response regulator [Bacteroidia bacterium]|nr:response regulator [Bacteroidia bacterium]
MIHLENKRILVVDDNPLGVKILMNQMQSWKMLPIVADTGKQALDILSQNSEFDLVIIDMNMLVMNGIELVIAIRNKCANTPLMLMNSAGDELYMQKPELFRSVLTKPVGQNIFKDQLLGIFSQSETDKQNREMSMTDNFAKKFPLLILIAEDNLINQKIAIKILTKLGYEPALANNGKEVMEMVRQVHYDIILMDVQMPEMDGLEATRMIRTCLEIQPIIMAMTANVLQRDTDACIQAGMDDYIRKPIDLKELISHLEKWALVIKEKRQTV